MPDTTGLMPDTLRVKPIGPIVRAEDLGAWHRADAAMATVKREALKLHAHIVAARDAERRRGFEEGQQEGKKEAIALIAATTAKVDGHLADLEPEIAEIVLEAVQAILGSVEPRELALRAARQAVAKARRGKSLKVHVPPSLVSDLRRRLEEELDAEVSKGLVTVHGDPSLEPGACWLVSELGFVDASVDVQIAALRAALETGRKES